MEGGSPRLWAFGYKSLAALLGIKEGTVRQAVHQGRLDPSDLEMVCESWLRYHPSKAIALAAQLQAGSLNSPQDEKLIEALRVLARERAERDKLNAEEEVMLMKTRCKEAPVLLAGPRPGEMVDERATLDREVRGDINARCAAAQNRSGAKCKACGLDVEVHTPEGIVQCMDKLAGPSGPGKGEDLPDPCVPF